MTLKASYRCKRLYRPNSADGGCPARADMKGLTAESYFGFDVSRQNAVNGTLYLDNEDAASGDGSGGTLWAEIQCGPSANSVDCYNSSNGYVKSARATTTEQQGRQVASCMDIVVGVKYEVSTLGLGVWESRVKLGLGLGLGSSTSIPPVLYDVIPSLLILVLSSS